MQRMFYATPEDLLPVLDYYDSKQDVKYVRTGMFHSPELIVFNSGRSISTIFQPAPYVNAIAGFNYLVTPSNEKVNIRPCPQSAGGVRYAVDQAINGRTFTLLHGGIFEERILLYGRVATSVDDTIALKLFRSFSRAIEKHFTRIKAFYVGPNAESLLDSGFRLGDAASPMEYDLRR